MDYMGVGKFLEKNFKNQPVELLVDHDAEWHVYAESTKINGMVIHGTFVEFDEESKVLTMATIENGALFYLCEDFIQMFWAPGFKCVESLKAIWGGQKLFKNKKGQSTF
jgi:hypothetical protein